jgi:hypothetical protein
MRAIYDKPTAKIESFSSRIRAKKRMPILATYSKYSIVIPSQSN